MALLRYMMWLSLYGRCIPVHRLYKSVWYKAQHIRQPYRSQPKIDRSILPQMQHLDFPSYPIFHSTSEKWNLGLTQEFPSPANVMLVDETNCLHVTRKWTPMSSPNQSTADMRMISLHTPASPKLVYLSAWFIPMSFVMLYQTVPHPCDTDPCDIRSNITWLTHPLTLFIICHCLWYKSTKPWLWNPINNIKLEGTSMGFQSAFSLMKSHGNPHNVILLTGLHKLMSWNTSVYVSHFFNSLLCSVYKCSEYIYMRQFSIYQQYTGPPSSWSRWSCVSAGIFHVKPIFHPTPVGWNLKLIQKLPAFVCGTIYKIIWICKLSGIINGNTFIYNYVGYNQS